MYKRQVLEPLAVYLKIARVQYMDISKAGYYNVGPDDCDCITTGDLVTMFCDAWGGGCLLYTSKKLWRP